MHRSNTVLIFASDNGPVRDAGSAWPLRSKKILVRYSLPCCLHMLVFRALPLIALPLATMWCATRGMKSSHWSGGIRVPAFVASPLLPPRAHASSATMLMHVTDIHPTILVPVCSAVISGLVVVRYFSVYVQCLQVSLKRIYVSVLFLILWCRVWQAAPKI
jgi:arylsulfatase A-like enzyme